MWPSIQHIEHPISLADACKLNDTKEKTLFAGGTYLTAKKNREIHTLIDINHLIKDTIEEKDGEIIIGAKNSLQKLIDHFGDKQISICAKYSCYSKNIRNQRTVGGEIAEKRTTSELCVFFMTINAKLQVFCDGEIKNISIRDWDGKGIIASIVYQKKVVRVKRYALIPSAPAFVIVGIDAETNSCAIGGRCSKITTCDVVSDKKAQEEKISEVLSDVFVDDHHGSVTYKKHLVMVSLLSDLEGEK